jgi:hypothetical protein
MPPDPVVAPPEPVLPPEPAVAPPEPVVAPPELVVVPPEPATPPEPFAPPEPGEVLLFWSTTVPVRGKIVDFGVRVNVLPETQYE